MDRSPGFGSTDTDVTPYSDSLSLRLRLNTLTMPVPRNSQVHSSIGTRLALLAHWPFTVCKHTVSCSISLPFGGSFHLSLTVLVRYRSLTEYLALEDGPPSFRQGFSCPALLRNSRQSPIDLAYGTITVFGAAFQPASAIDRIFYFAHDIEIVDDCPTTPLYATPQCLHVYGLGCSRFARHYYGNLG